MDCQAAETNLSLYVDGELDPRGRLAVELHLRRCAPCQAAFKQIQGIRKCLGKTRKRVCAPEDFSVSLQSRLRQLESSSFLSSARTTTKVRRTVIYTVIGVALSMAAGLFALLMLVQHSRRNADLGVAQWRPAQAPLAAVGPQGSSLSFVLVREGWPAGEPPPLAPAMAPGVVDQKPQASVSY